MTYSVIIPTFKEEAHLRLLLSSIIRQTVLPVEVIVADNESQDSTRDIARQFGCIIVPGGSPGEGRNAGARRATSDILIFLDADVILPTQTTLPEIVREFDRRKLDVASTIVAPGTTNNLYVHIACGVANITKHMNSMLSAFGLILGEIGMTIIVRKSIFDRIGGFRAPFGTTHTHEDTVFFRDILQTGARYGVILSPVVISDRRIVGKSFLHLTAWSGLLMTILAASFLGLRPGSALVRTYEKLRGGVRNNGI
jgi:GT2 family glycosyltransferase